MPLRPFNLAPFQADGVEWLVDHDRALLADSMGLGKTVQAYEASRRLELGTQQVLWFAPASTIPGLEAMLRSYGADVCAVRTGQELPMHRYLLCSYDRASALKKALRARKYGLVVLDECHKGKNSQARRTKVILGFGETPGIVDNAPRCWCLSGTAMPNRPVELQGVLYRALKQEWANPFSYKQTYCRRRNPYCPGGYDFLGADNLDDLRKKLSNVMLRRTPEDVAGQLPPLRRTLVPLTGIPEAPLPGSKDALVAMLGTRGPGPMFEELSLYRQQMGTAKAKNGSLWIEDWCMSSGVAPVVFFWHRAVGRAYEEILNLLGFEVFRVDGDCSPKERQALIDKFAAGAGDILLASIPACGTGLNGMQRRTNCCIFVESSWCPADLDQAEGRVRRKGGLGQEVLSYYLVVNDSLEAHILGTAINKDFNARIVLGGRDED
jgi:SNF2 family DNA or RNA helicase